MDAGERDALLEDLSGVASNIVDAAIAVTAGRVGLDSPSEAVTWLARGDGAAILHFRLEVARQLAAVLLDLDDNILAIYQEHDLLAEGDHGMIVPSLSDTYRVHIRLVRATAALRTIVSVISNRLAERLSERLEKLVPRWIQAVFIEEGEDDHLRSRATPYRPTLLLLAARGSHSPEQRSHLRSLSRSS